MSASLKPFKWFYHEFGIAAIHETGRNAWIVILARTCRMFAFGTSSLILAIFFSALGYTDHQIGIFMTLTLLGDVFLGTYLTFIADRVGRRKVLLGGSVLMILSGIVFAIFESFWILLAAAILGVVSVFGGDFGPFRSIEESVLSQLTTPSTRADVLAWYVTISSFGSSIGSEAAGRIIQSLQEREGWTVIDAYHALYWIYTAMGTVNTGLVLLLTDACELSTRQDVYESLPQQEDESVQTSHRIESSDVDAHIGSAIKRPFKIFSWLSSKVAEISRPTLSIMYKFWLLTAFDSFADGLVPYSLTNYYLDTSFHPTKSTLGDVQSVAYLLSAVGSVFAGPLARRFGLINTMVFTHVPSSAAVLVFPLAPSFWIAAALLFVRTGLNNMDQAPRAAFMAAVVKPEERTAVMGITGNLRTLAAMVGPLFTGLMAENNKFWLAFVIAGACRLSYDFILYVLFTNVVLYQHETKPGELPSTSSARPRNESNESLEMQSLADSEDSLRGRTDEEDGVMKKGSMAGGLQLPSANERVRSRSPHRSTVLDS